MISEITSKQNDIIKSTKALLERKERKKTNLFLLEGERFISDLDENVIVKYVLATKEHNIENFSCENKYILTEALFNYISDVKSPQGIAVVCEIPNYSTKELFNSSRVIYLEAVQNADNVGAIIRSAACLGYNAVVLDENCADPYSPKALRAAAGNTFKIKIYTQKNLSILTEMKDSGFTICGANLKGDTSAKLDNEKLTLIIGNEGNGMSSEATNLCDKLIKIQMHSNCESLNAACAATLLMYISMNM